MIRCIACREVAQHADLGPGCIAADGVRLPSILCSWASLSAKKEYEEEMAWRHEDEYDDATRSWRKLIASGQRSQPDIYLQRLEYGVNLRRSHRPNRFPPHPRRLLALEAEHRSPWSSFSSLATCISRCGVMTFPRNSRNCSCVQYPTYDQIHRLMTRCGYRFQERSARSCARETSVTRRHSITSERSPRM